MGALTPTPLRKLEMLAPTQPGGEPWVSAASGLVRAGEWLYVVADDELHLARFRSDGTAPGEWLRLFPGELPEKKKPRKRAKLDTECLALLPPTADAPGGSLLALGSGSGPLRCRAAQLPLARDGTPAGPVRRIDVSTCLAALEADLPELNIEGAVVRSSRVTLLHRGNKGGAPNALVTIPVEDLWNDAGPRNVAICTVDLGAIGAVPLTLTDGTCHPDGGLLVTAVAEDTDNRWHDGACSGAALAHVRDDGTIRWLRQLEGRPKVEGVELRRAGAGLECLLVTDPDDRRKAATLYRVILPPGDANRA